MVVPMVFINISRKFFYRKIAILFFILPGVSCFTHGYPHLMQKKWGNIVNEIPEAERLMKQSNDYYLQMGNIESDVSIDENKKQKQLAKTEVQALEYYNKSLFKYKDLYTGLYSLIEKNIGETNKTHPAYTNMVYFNNQASVIFNSTSEVTTDENRKQLSQANEYLLSAIEKGISVFNTPPESYISTTKSVSESIPSADSQLNAEFYKKYKDYIENTSIPDPVVLNQLLQLEDDDASFEAFKKCGTAINLLKVKNN